MQTVKKPYQLNLRLRSYLDVPRYEFDRLRKMERLFEWRPSRPRLLRLRKQFVAWVDEHGRAHFQEKTLSGDKSRSLLVDSCELVRKKCGPLDRRFIEDPVEMQRAIEAMYT